MNVELLLNESTIISINCSSCHSQRNGTEQSLYCIMGTVYSLCIVAFEMYVQQTGHVW